MAQVRHLGHKGPTPVSAPQELVKDIVRVVVPRPVRNWLRSPSRSLEWIWDNLTFSAGYTKPLNITPDVTITLHPRAYRVAYQNQVRDADQSAEFRNFIAHCNGEMFLFDIGAHYGLFSLAAAALKARAVSVDASREAISMISRQAALNHQEKMIRVLHAAISDHCGSLHMLDSGAFSNGYFKSAAGRPLRELTNVRAITIDAMSQDFGAPTHIKIDVEGHEAEVIAGARETLKTHSPLLFVELHNELLLADGGDPRAALNALDNAGYRTFSLAGKVVDQRSILQQPLIRVVAKPHALDRN